LGSFRVTPFLLDHSAYDAYALLVEAEGKRLFYSGDFRDHGRKRTRLTDLMANPPPVIDALLMEGTTLGRSQGLAPSLREADLENDFARCFNETRGLALVHVSAQNIDRLVTIFRACLRSKRTMVIDLYTALILEATRNPRIPQSHWEQVALCIPERQRIQIKRKGLFDELARHSRHRIYPGWDIAKHPDQFVLLFRSLWMPDLERAKLLHGAGLIHSQWDGYLKQPSFQDIREWAQRHHLAFHQIHTSGHADPDVLRLFSNTLAPKILVPIHSNVPEAFAGLFPRVAARANGEWWEI
jgi:ribonuclease J